MDVSAMFVVMTTSKNIRAGNEWKEELKEADIPLPHWVQII
jgi:hypothetical protein